MSKERTPETVNTNTKTHAIWCCCVECNAFRENFNAHRAESIKRERKEKP